jgi:predicted O-methyltransferase YrrM
VLKTNKLIKNMNFDNKIESVLKKYHQRMDAETALIESESLRLGNGALMARRDEFLLSVGVETAQFLNTLAKAARSKTILEIGTSYGYSTVWLAEAARANHGKLITLELSVEKAHYAQQQIHDAGLSDFVEFRIGDAIQSIENAHETYDFILLDIWKELYVPCFDAFFPKLNKGAWVIGDNMIFPPSSRPEAMAYQQRVRSTHAFDTVLMPIGSGIEVSCYKI